MYMHKLKTHHFDAAIISSGENTSPGNGIRSRPKTSYHITFKDRLTNCFLMSYFLD